MTKGLETITSNPIGFDSTSPMEDEHHRTQPIATAQELKPDDSDLSEASGGDNSDDSDDDNFKRAPES